MSDMGNNLTVTARLIDELSKPMKAMAAQVSGTTTLMDTQAKKSKLAGSSLTDYQKSVGTLGSSLTSLDSRLTTISGSLESKFTSAVKRGTQALALLTAGATAFGLKAALGFEQAIWQVQTFGQLTSTQANTVTRQLRAMSNPVSLAGEVQGYGALMATPGTTTSGSLKMLSRLNSIAATQSDPTSSLASLTSAVNILQQSQTISARQLRTFARSDADAYALLAQVYHTTPWAAAQMIKSGSPLATKPFLQALVTPGGPLGKYDNAIAGYRATPIGAGKEVEKQLGALLTDALQPFIERMAPALTRFGTWVTAHGPQITAFVGQVLHALEPFGADLLRLAGGLLVASVALVKFVTPIVDFISHSGALRSIVEGLLVALLAYKAVGLVTGYVQGFLTTIKAVGTFLKGGGFGGLTQADPLVSAATALDGSATALDGAATALTDAAAVLGGRGPGAPGGTILPAGGGTGETSAAGAGPGDAAINAVDTGALLLGRTGAGLGADGSLAGGPTVAAMMITRPYVQAAGRGVGHALGIEPTNMQGHHVWDLLPGTGHSDWKPLGNDINNWSGSAAGAIGGLFGGGGGGHKKKPAAMPLAARDSIISAGDGRSTLVVTVNQQFQAGITAADASAVKGAADAGTRAAIEKYLRDLANRASHGGYKAP